MREIFNAQVIDIVHMTVLLMLWRTGIAFEKGNRSLAGTWKPEGFRKQVIETGQLLLINQDLNKKSIEASSKVLLGEHRSLSFLFR